MTREQFISDLRSCADFYEQHPEIKVLPRPYLFADDFTDNAKETLRTFAKAAGKAEKKYTDSEIQVALYFPGGLMVRYDSPRDKVCERVVVGTKIIPAYTLPARAAAVVIPEKVEEIVEWHCHSLLEEEAHV
jgi:hypothetical protein